MKTTLLWLFLAAAFVTACGSSNNNSNKGSAATATKTTAASVTAAPATASTDVVAVKKTPASLAADDAAWTDVKATAIKTQVIQESKAKNPVDVNMQALYSDTDVWFRFQWSDDTHDATTVWQWDGSKWSSPSHTTDRFSLYWEFQPVPEFEALGCAALCHKEGTDIAKWYMIAPHATPDAINNWQWQPATVGAMGQVDDRVLKGVQTGDPNTAAYRESAFVADPSTGGGTKGNTNQAGDGPASMQDPSKPPTYGPDYLAVTDAVTLDVSKLKPGDKIPKTLLAPYQGERGVMDSKTQWASGQYTLVVHRKLDTGFPNDVKFTVGGTFTFGLAVWNQLDQENHTVTTVPYHLVLK